MTARLVVAALTTVVACACVARASVASASAAKRTNDLSTSRGAIPDVTEVWSSPGAVWIARQLRQVNPAWGIVASDLDMLAREWCSPYTRTAIQRLLYALPGADLRALPASTQLVQALRASCYTRGRYSSDEIDYWTYVTSGKPMTLVRSNVRHQAQAASYAWQRPAPRSRQRCLRNPAGSTNRVWGREQYRIVVADEGRAQRTVGMGGTRWFGREGGLSRCAQLGGQALPLIGKGPAGGRASARLRRESRLAVWVRSGVRSCSAEAPWTARATYRSLPGNPHTLERCRTLRHVPA